MLILLFQMGSGYHVCLCAVYCMIWKTILRVAVNERKKEIDLIEEISNRRIHAFFSSEFQGDEILLWLLLILLLWEMYIALSCGDDSKHVISDPGEDS